MMLQHTSVERVMQMGDVTDFSLSFSLAIFVKYLAIGEAQAAF